MSQSGGGVCMCVLGIWCMDVGLREYDLGPVFQSWSVH